MLNLVLTAVRLSLGRSPWTLTESVAVATVASSDTLSPEKSALRRRDALCGTFVPLIFFAPRLACCRPSLRSESPSTSQCLSPAVTDTFPTSAFTGR